MKNYAIHIEQSSNGLGTRWDEPHRGYPPYLFFLSKKNYIIGKKKGMSKNNLRVNLSFVSK